MASSEILSDKYSEELSDILEHSLNEIFIVDFNTLHYLYANIGACTALGYTKSELLKMNLFDINPELTPKHVDFINESSNEKQGMLNRSTHKRKDGSIYSVQSYIYKKKYHDKDAYIIFSTDISEHVELELKHQQQSKILEHIHESVISTDLNGKITSYNRGSEVLLGYSENEILGENIEKIYCKNNEYSFKALAKVFEKEVDYDIEAFLVKKDGTRVVCDISLSSIKDSDGTLSGIVGYSQDITSKKEAEKLL
jgi:PAS domain S-box-containing protein